MSESTAGLRENSSELTSVEREKCVTVGGHLERLAAMIASAKNIGDLRAAHKYGDAVDFKALEVTEEIIGATGPEETSSTASGSEEGDNGGGSLSAAQSLGSTDPATDASEDLPPVAAALESQRAPDETAQAAQIVNRTGDGTPIVENGGAGEAGGLHVL